eukprot:scaffold15647_cov269-Alexandrium_tamarense.AAC.1
MPYPTSSAFRVKATLHLHQEVQQQYRQDPHVFLRITMCIEIARPRLPMHHFLSLKDVLSLVCVRSESPCNRPRIIIVEDFHLVSVQARVSSQVVGQPSASFCENLIVGDRILI